MCLQRFENPTRPDSTPICSHLGRLRVEYGDRDGAAALLCLQLCSQQAASSVPRDTSTQPLAARQLQAQAARLQRWQPAATAAVTAAIAPGVAGCGTAPHGRCWM